MLSGGSPDNPEFAGQPQPRGFAGQPQGFTGQPQGFAGQPREFAGQPQRFAGGLLCGPYKSLHAQGVTEFCGADHVASMKPLSGWSEPADSLKPNSPDNPKGSPDNPKGSPDEPGGSPDIHRTTPGFPPDNPQCSRTTPRVRRSTFAGQP